MLIWLCVIMYYVYWDNMWVVVLVDMCFDCDVCVMKYDLFCLRISRVKVWCLCVVFCLLFEICKKMWLGWLCEYL